MNNTMNHVNAKDESRTEHEDMETDQIDGSYKQFTTLNVLRQMVMGYIIPVVSEIRSIFVYFSCRVLSFPAIVSIQIYTSSDLRRDVIDVDNQQT